MSLLLGLVWWAVGWCGAVGDPGQPLVLTPYLEAGQISQARAEAAVRLPGTRLPSYSGYFTVNTTHNSNMFFWFFPSQLSIENAPVVLWLQGGPGLSSLFALFTENGPFFVDKAGYLRHRQYSWSTVFNLIYIDSPVGAGFSFTEADQGYANNQADVGRDLYEALTQFFTLFPNLQNNDFFITGESYAGKFIPAIAYTIHTNNDKNSNKINLKGLAIGNGFTDPGNMMLYGDYLYQIGLIDKNKKRIFDEKQYEIVRNIKDENYLKAFEGFRYLIRDEIGSLFNNVTGFSFYYNFLHSTETSRYGDYEAYVQKPDIRRSLHVGNNTFHDNSIILEHLKSEFMQSINPWVEELLENYRVLFYNGQLDIMCAYPLMVNFLEKFNWSGASEYRSTDRKQWFVEGELAGYYKTVKGFTEVLVRNSGHMVPDDQPKWMFDLITSFVFNGTL